LSVHDLNLQVCSVISIRLSISENCTGEGGRISEIRREFGAVIGVPVTMFELRAPSPAVRATGGDSQCTLCQMIACPKLARDPEVGLLSSNQCAIHSAVVFVIVDYLWRLFQA
jgi:hypothetical protein